MLASSVWTWLHRLGGPGLLLIGIIDASAVPMPGSVDAFLVVLAARRPAWWPYYALMAVVGAMIGGFVTYRLAKKGGEEALHGKIGRRNADKLRKNFQHRGFGTVAAAAILPPPFPTFPVLLAAGVMQYPPKKFLAALGSGRAVRYFALGYLAHAYGRAILTALSPYYQPMLYALIGLAAAGGVCALIYFAWYRPRKHREQGRRGENVQDSRIPLRDDSKKSFGGK